MSNKKMLLILGSLVLIMSGTALIAIRMIDRKLTPLILIELCKEEVNSLNHDFKRPLGSIKTRSNS
jgi:hypothetical protein